MSAVEQRTDGDAFDQQLVVQYQRGNANALAELYRRHGRRTESVARHVVGPTSELEDIVQDVFIEVQRALYKFRGDSRFTTWLHRITVNVALQYVRKGKRKGWLRWLALDPVALGLKMAQGQDSRYEARDTCRQLYDILGTLPEKKYVVFTLFELEGMSLEEIAQTLDISVNTVKSRLFHARKEVFDAAKTCGALPAHALQVIK
jgi:RNA polymerase sigma-70 factor (ECF subfamily)